VGAQTATSTLTVSTWGGASGTVTSSPAGISCGSTCSASFANGTKVSLTATPSSGNVFVVYGGACSGDSCTVSVASSTNVIVRFETPVGATQALKQQTAAAMPNSSSLTGSLDDAIAALQAGNKTKAKSALAAYNNALQKTGRTGAVSTDVGTQLVHLYSRIYATL
jgi:hypothetical protein